MLADDLSDYLYTRSTGHFASLMTLISRGCLRAIRTGQERLSVQLMDKVANDAAAEPVRRRCGQHRARPPRRRAPARVARQTGSRFCPACLRDTDGRWLLRWRLPWAFACPVHAHLLVDVCPGCGKPPSPHRPGT